VTHSPSPPPPPNPPQLAEWWNPDFKDLFLYFDSWQQLKDMLADPNLAQRTAPLKRKAVQRMAELRHTWVLLCLVRVRVQGTAGHLNHTAAVHRSAQPPPPPPQHANGLQGDL
jgi:hypothetical protein